MENEIVILLGSCAVGKDTIAKMLNKKGYEYVISTTTRPIRDGESERDPYIYTDNRSFEYLINNKKLIEYRKYKSSNGKIWYYGVEEEEIDKTKNYVAVLDPIGLYGFNEYFPNNVISFFLDASIETRKERCIKRGDYNEKEWEYRLESDNGMFTEEFIKEHINYVIDSERTEEEIFNEILLKIEEYKKENDLTKQLKRSLEGLLKQAVALKNNLSPNTEQADEELLNIKKEMESFTEYLDNIVEEVKKNEN